VRSASRAIPTAKVTPLARRRPRSALLAEPASGALAGVDPLPFRD